MLKRRTKARRRAPGSCPEHLQWVRGFPCAVPRCTRGPVVAAHVRNSDLTPSTEKGGTGKKPWDMWVIPLCDAHHHEQHACGEATFEARYRIDMGRIAQQLQRQSPHRTKWEQS